MKEKTREFSVIASERKENSPENHIHNFMNERENKKISSFAHSV